jgi:transcriptional regulator with XRE-family HTH domain
MKMKIADQIKSRRITAQLTQAKLANRTGVSQGKIGDWERGVQTPTVESLEKLATVLGPFTIGEDMRTIFQSDNTTVELGSAGTVVIGEQSDTYSFPSVSAAATHCNNTIANGNGEWWVTEYGLILEALKTC